MDKFVQTNTYKFRPFVTVEGGTFPEARNKLLKVLAKAEQDGKIQRFSINHDRLETLEETRARAKVSA